MIHGETLATGASPVCTDCGIILKLQILHSFAGYYIGSECNCEPTRAKAVTIRAKRKRKRRLNLGDTRDSKKEQIPGEAEGAKTLRSG